MKKTILFVIAALTSSIMVSAQDFATATQTAKAASEALSNGNYIDAFNGFKTAMEQAAACTEEGVAEFLQTCKTGAVSAVFNGANQLVKDGKLEEAMDKLDEVMKIADEYGVQDIKEKAVKLKLQVVKLYANNQIKAAAAATTPEEKSACFTKALDKLEILIAEGSADGKTYIQKGQVLKSLGKKDDAVQAFLTAKDMGEEAAANKQLANIYLGDAQKCHKAKNYTGAIAAAAKALEYDPNNANAYKISGYAANANKDPKAAIGYLSKYLEISPSAKDAAQIKSAIEALKAQVAQTK